MEHQLAYVDAIDIQDSLIPVEPEGMLDPTAETADHSSAWYGRVLQTARRVGKPAVAAAAALVGLSTAPMGGSEAAASPANTPAVPANATYMGGELWNIKDIDESNEGNVGNFEWVDCGYTIYPNAQSTFAPCKPGQVAIYTSEQTLSNDLSQNKIAPGSTVIYDNETWGLTPKAEKGKNLTLSLQQAVRVSHSHGVKIMETPFVGSPGGNQAADVNAAKAGADIIDIQDQTIDSSPAAYVKAVEQDVTAIRAVNPSVVILAGLSTDAGGKPTGVRTLYEDFNKIKPDSRVSGLWINVHIWTTHASGCADTGCGPTAKALINKIDYGIAFPPKAAKNKHSQK